MNAADLATEAAAAINKAAWAAYKAGDTSAASATWAAAQLVTDTFTKGTA